ncbi:MAG: RNA polymerase-associated protein RapA [Proteobacteria bacterium]|nr:RNA polymerase-associated protein RapA [Pseudomonadota bacterium]NOG61384.1 RNA polymerase-associated protein RapA [Pseudomonadota bacterium]
MFSCLIKSAAFQCLILYQGYYVSEFVIGQRWVSHTETELGLGIIVAVEGRRVEISFPAADEQRIYATDTAPLTRIEHKLGETIRNQDEQSFKITRTEQFEGRLIYFGSDDEGQEHKIDELDLNCFIELTSPKQRLISGQLDSLKAFRLRCETLMQLHRLQQSSVKGLLGSRTSLLPHQIYIAHEVAKRYAPRVLLADEVGLGKTIEAGMILHYQLHTGLASRILIVVPDTLTHQWLVEMLRRFNLRFSLFNEDRLHALSEEEGNPFESEQLVICSLDILTSDPGLFNHALNADWDMVVVDEAHHLHWIEGDEGHDYRCIEALANQCRGLLLLTATPEQVGAESHFARLRLLDPARFHDLEIFLDEEKGYQQLSETVKTLLDKPDQLLTDGMLKLLKQYLDDEAPVGNNPEVSEREQIVSKLLDRHGTGRVFLRNTREAIKGFPERKLHNIPLECPKIYSTLSGKQTLFPEIEINNDDWLKQDPRVQFLIKLVEELKAEKILVICANANTASSLEKYLQLKMGIRSAAFYEGLSIIERDRAAAYFADAEMGAQVLVCSEIGSEGRNFQFAHHLVLFDLPLNPDLLEQRIGRLDRIGQTETINIHVPYIENSSQEILFNWYNNGLDIFLHSCAAAYSIYEKFEEPLNEALDKPDSDISTLVVETNEYTNSVKQSMQDGRDRLVELNSCRKDIAEDIINTIKNEESPQLLMDYMESMFNTYGVDHEEHSENAWILRATDHMRTGYFPGVIEEPVTITFDRNKALSREDMPFVSWEHPMVSEAIEMVLKSEIGNTFITTIEKDGIEPGTILLETFSSINVISPKQLQVDRYLPITPLRTLISKDRKDYSKLLKHEKLNMLSMKIERQTAHAIIKQLKPELEIMIDFAIKFSQSKLPEIKEKAQQRVNTLLGSEVKRMQQLQKKNATIRTEEIEFMEEQLHACNEVISNARYELQAVRLVIVQ